MSWLYRVLTISGLLAVLYLGYGAWVTHQQGIGEARATADYNTVIDKQKAKAVQLLQTETDRANAASAKLVKFRTEREKHDAENKSVIAGLASRLRAAAGAAGRLRDPNASHAGCGSGGGGASGADSTHSSGGAADEAEARGFLSKQLTEFLLRQAADADQVNLAYTSCRLDALSLREVLR